MLIASVEQLAMIAARHQNQIIAVRDNTRRAIEAAWRRIVVGPTEQIAAAWIATAAPILQAGMSAAASATLSYITTYVAAATGAPPTRSDLVAADFLTPRGVPIEEVLQRPIVSVRTALRDGSPLPEALDLGGQRAAQTAATDPMLAARAAGSAAMKADPKIVGWRRVPDAKACTFCLLAATQRYHDSDLMAMHPGCGCTVAPIVGSKDPGQVIDRDTLRRLKADGVSDEITYKRRITEATKVADSYDAKSAHWREQSRTTTDQAKETRYAKRADEWARHAAARRAQAEPDRQRLKDLRAGRLDRLTAVHQHGELGPTLYGAGDHFDAA